MSAFQLFFKYFLWRPFAVRGDLWIALGLALGVPQGAAADVSFIEVVPGYTDQPALEKEHIYSELVVPQQAAPKPSQTVKMSYTPLIFDRRISAELKDKYQRTFGDTEVEITHRLPVMGNEDKFSFRYLHRPEEDLEKQKVFREYMVQRLVEHNLDKVLKESKSGRIVHQVKERVQSANLKVAKKTEVRAKFSVFNQQVDVSVNNPHVNTRVLWDPSRSDPYLILTKSASKKLSFRGIVDWERDHYRLTASERISSLLSASLSAITRRRSEVLQEHMVLAGLYYRWP